MNTTPEEVQKVLKKWSEYAKMSYGDYLVMLEELNDLGWTCDYTMGGKVVDLKRMKSYSVIKEYDHFTQSFWYYTRVSDEHGERSKVFGEDLRDDFVKYTKLLDAKGYYFKGETERETI
jgi:hypothetical protein